MLENYVRTDLALELKEDISEKNDIAGVRVETYEDSEYGLTKTHIRVLDQTGAEILGKPIGNYITLESSKLCSEDENIHMPFVLALHDVLKELLHGEDHILVIGLGNRNITPDALGPSVVDHLYITRHLLREGVVKHSMEISALCPGVMAQTGIETSTIIQSLCREINPDVVICIDALAAREAERLNTTIQVCDTGITPGAGVGNRRLSLNEETLGVPVIAVGVPTVISMPAMISHAMEGLLEKLPVSVLRQYEKEIVEFIQTPTVSSMFVTPKNIDELIGRVSFTISEAINRFLT